MKIFLILFVLLPMASLTWGRIPVGDELPDDYIPFTLSLSDSGLVGSSEHLPGFVVTMDMPPTIFPDSLDLPALRSLVRERHPTGTLTYPSGRTTEISYDLVHHRGPPEIYMETTLGYFLWEYVSVAGNEVSMAIYWWYSPPATPADLETVRMAQRLLAEADDWHQEDDRECADDIETTRWSLFCALKHASIVTLGEYNHHNKALQTARFVIDELVPDHGFDHTLMDFNNAPTTRHSDILNVLELTWERIDAEVSASESNRTKED